MIAVCDTQEDWRLLLHEGQAAAGAFLSGKMQLKSSVNSSLRGVGVAQGTGNGI